jgi:hypothetical protein
VLAERGDEVGGERDGGFILKEKAEAFAELDDEAGAELARELDFNEAGIGAGRAAGWTVCGLDIPARMHGQRRMDRGWILGRLLPTAVR